MSIDPTFADLLTGAQAKFGKDVCYSGTEHKNSVIGVPCPLLWGWFVGGCDVAPLQRIIGCDGRSGSYKSVLMSLEHALWFIRAGGVAVIIDTEEKTSESLLRAFTFRLKPAERARLIYMRARSIDEAQQMISYYKKRASEFMDVEPDKRIPIYVSWDSLTGAASEAAQEKVEKEGNAQAKQFGDAAPAISKFYQSLIFDKSWMSLGHVQHAKPSMDPNARGDDSFVAAGGNEPRFKASYHFRALGSSDFASESSQGKEILLKCIKSGFGPDKRKIRIRAEWRYVWVETPEITEDGVVPGTEELPADQVEAYYNHNQQALSYSDATKLAEYLRLGQGVAVTKPKASPARFQQMWINWDWSLGNFLVHEYKYGEDTYKKEKDDLDEVLYFVRGANQNQVKCKELFGDDEPRTLEEFGAAIHASPEVSLRLKRLLGICTYKTVNELRAAEPQNEAKPEPKRRGRPPKA